MACRHSHATNAWIPFVFKCVKEYSPDCDADICNTCDKLLCFECGPVVTRSSCSETTCKIASQRIFVITVTSFLCRLWSSHDVLLLQRDDMQRLQANWYL